MSAGNGTPPKVCLLGQPVHGLWAAWGSGHAVHRCSSGEHLIVKNLHAPSSLLAYNFNRLWCQALNQSRRERIDYFAMLHNDIEPEAGWLDVLVDELEARGLDVLSAVVPIKDRRGLTSTALARPDGNPWRVHTRLTMKEIFQLPETFTSDDVGYPLLLNTGCWVCRFDESWASQVHFTINDRIDFDPDRADTPYVPQVESEDWYFSRRCHELGLKLGATRKVRLFHYGDIGFDNHRPWGDDFDSSHLERSVLDGDEAATDDAAAPAEVPVEA